MGKCCSAKTAPEKPAAESGCCAVTSQKTARQNCCGSATSVSPKPPVNVVAGERLALRVPEMCCPTEESLIRHKLTAIAQVTALEFNLMQRSLVVIHQGADLQEIKQAIRQLGFTPEQPDAAVRQQNASRWWPMLLAAGLALASEVVGWLPGLSGLSGWIPAVLAIVAIAICGLGTYKKGWLALRHGNLNINSLMTIAVTGAALLGEWPEAAMVMVLFAIAEKVEQRSMDRARNAIAGLLQLTPETVTVQQPDGSWLDMAASKVNSGARVRVRPGERIGLDGLLTEGSSAVNQAPITGESIPVDKVAGDKVFAGTVNESGSFVYQVTGSASNTTLARIIRAVEQAQSNKAPIQRFVDKFARIYTPLVFVAALAIGVLPPLLMALSWHDWIYKALVLLVIACPCALVISTPVTIVSGLAAAARQGILIKGGVYLEQGRLLKWLALDKTGTITHGKPVLTDTELWQQSADAKRCKRLAGSLACRSDHPVSVAVANATVDAGLEVIDFAAIPGRGIQGVIAAEQYYLGNHRLMDELGLASAELQLRLQALEQQGKTVVMLADTHQVLMLFAVADTVKDSSREAIAQLHALGVKTVMLTGDNPYTAQAIAGQVGIDAARGNQLPEDKLTAVNSFAAEGQVGMVGDGINDAPALAQSDIGFAMGAMGTDTAIETADVALMDDDLRKIPAFLRLSHSTRRILAQNIGMALGIKAVFLVLTMVGLGTMWMAVFADVGASLLVVANGLRLLRQTG